MKINFPWSRAILQCCVGLLLYSKVSRFSVSMNLLFFGLLSHFGHHRALSSLFFTVGTHSLS